MGIGQQNDDLFTRCLPFVGMNICKWSIGIMLGAIYKGQSYFPVIAESITFIELLL